MTSARQVPDADPAGSHNREGFFETVAFPSNEVKDSSRKFRSASRRETNEDDTARRSSRSEHQPAKITVFRQDYPALGTRELDYSLIGRARGLLNDCNDIKPAGAQIAHHREIAALVG